MDSTAAPRYAPIADYALIGDCHGCALVGRGGRIDWAALRRFDADPVFCRLLDADRGGHWTVQPRDPFTCERRYLADTNLLRTEFTTRTGRVAVLDFMPVGRTLDAGVHDYVHLNAPGWIVRRVECLQGHVAMESVYRPSVAFARHPATLRLVAGGVWADQGEPVLFADVPWSADGDTVRAQWDLAPGERRDLVLAATCVAGESPLERVQEFLDATQAFWSEWIAYCRYRGPYADAVRRSALTLKLLTYAPTGAMVAAPTTSLPEEIGGTRNWDYRFCWVRDASFALYALAVLGYSGEARCFHEYLQRSIARSLPVVLPLYGIDGALRPDEATQEHLEGYRQSAPVRTGNQASRQQQLDVYGQMLDLAMLYHALGGRLDRQYRRLLGAVARFLASRWRDPDQGIWEMRGPARHHVHGKLMAWVGLDRAARLLGGEWTAARASEAATQIAGQALDPATGALQQAYDGGTDAAVLLAPMLGFPLPPGSLQATIDRVYQELARGDFVARYHGADGLEGGEGAFLVCSAWLIDAELAAGHLDQAEARLQRLLACANDVGLFPEEVDAATGEHLGNFPQALTHLGVIGSAVNLALARRDGAGCLKGSYADRARHAVTATFGWRGVLAAMWQSRTLSRWRGSRRSRLAWP